MSYPAHPSQDMLQCFLCALVLSLNLAIPYLYTTWTTARLFIPSSFENLGRSEFCFGPCGRTAGTFIDDDAWQQHFYLSTEVFRTKDWKTL